MNGNPSNEKDRQHEIEAYSAGQELARQMGSEVAPGFGNELAKAFEHPFFNEHSGQGQVQHIREVERRVTQHTNGDVTMTEVQRDVNVFSFGKEIFKRKG